MELTGGPSDDNNDASKWKVSDQPWTGSTGDFGSPNFSSNAASDISDHSSELPQYFKLSNYPNPFNPKTVISYQVGANHNSPVHVELSIYNILGQKVSTLFSEVQTAGDYKVDWNADGMAGGVYFCVLRINGSGNGNSGPQIITRKMVLLK